MPTVGLPTVELTPRMVMLSWPGPFGPLLWAANEMPGTRRVRSSTLVASRAVRSAAVRTPMLTGTSLASCARWVAVTITSSSWASGPASLLAAASVAPTGPARVMAASAPPTASTLRAAILEVVLLDIGAAPCTAFSVAPVRSSAPTDTGQSSFCARAADASADGRRTAGLRAGGNDLIEVGGSPYCQQKQHI